MPRLSGNWVSTGWPSMRRPRKPVEGKQPATVPEINEIRGVNVGGVIKTLLEKRLITTAGRKEVIGRPILYRTSKQFMMRFGLSDLDELPSLKEFEQLAQAALGADEGIAPIEPESQALGQLNEPAAASPDAALSSGATAEPLEAAQIIQSGDTDDLAELAEDPNEVPAEIPDKVAAEASGEIFGEVPGQVPDEVRDRVPENDAPEEDAGTPRGAAAGK